MDEIETDAQGQKPKISDLAITSAIIPVVLIAVWSFALLLLHFGFFHLWLMPWEDILHNDSYLLVITLFFLAAVILGVFAVVRINKSSGQLVGKGIAIFGIGLSICVLISLAYLKVELILHENSHFKTFYNW